MLRGFYTAASGMISQQRVQEALSDNIANVNTPGYKADEPVLRAFPEMLLRQMGSNEEGLGQGPTRVRSGQAVGTLNTGSYVQELIPQFSQGPIRETGQPTDLALVDGVLPDETGSLFFTVENETGDVRYTRNGHFTVDVDGYLTTNEGYYVLDDNNNRIQPNSLDFVVQSNGQIEANGLNTNLGIAYVANVEEMVKEENNLWTGLDGAVAAVDAREQDVAFSILQNTLEGANVDPGKTMTDMMTAYRVFEQSQRMLKAYDENMQKTVTEIARLG